MVKVYCVDLHFLLPLVLFDEGGRVVCSWVWSYLLQLGVGDYNWNFVLVVSMW